MKFNANREQILEALKVCKSVRNAQSTLPILANVLVTNEGGRAVFVASDYETRVRVESEGEASGADAFTVGCDSMLKAVSGASKGSEFRFQNGKGAAVAFQNCSYSGTLNGMSAKDYPKFADFEPAHTMSVGCKALRDALAKVAVAMPTRDPRKVLLGICVRGFADHVKLVATDGKLLIIEQVATSDAFEGQFILAAEAVKALASHLPDEGDCEVKIESGAASTRPQVSFKFGRVLLTSKTLEGKYPQYEAVLPKSFERTFGFDKATMLNAIKWVSQFADRKNNGIEFAFLGDSCKLMASDYEVGTFEKEIPCEPSGEAFRILFNSKIIELSLKAQTGNAVRLHCNKPTTPATIDSGGETPLALLMPIKLTDYDRHEPEESDAEEVEA